MSQAKDNDGSSTSKRASRLPILQRKSTMGNKEGATETTPAPTCSPPKSTLPSKTIHLALNSSASIAKTTNPESTVRPTPTYVPNGHTKPKDEFNSSRTCTIPSAPTTASQISPTPALSEAIVGIAVSTRENAHNAKSTKLPRITAASSHRKSVASEENFFSRPTTMKSHHTKLRSSELGIVSEFEPSLAIVKQGNCTESESRKVSHSSITSHVRTNLAPARRIPVLQKKKEIRYSDVKAISIPSSQCSMSSIPEKDDRNIELSPSNNPTTPGILETKLPSLLETSDSDAELTSRGGPPHLKSDISLKDSKSFQQIWLNLVKEKPSETHNCTLGICNVQPLAELPHVDSTSDPELQDHPSSHHDSLNYSHPIERVREILNPTNNNESCTKLIATTTSSVGIFPSASESKEINGISTSQRNGVQKDYGTSDSPQIDSESLPVPHRKTSLISFSSRESSLSLPLPSMSTPSCRNNDTLVKSIPQAFPHPVLEQDNNPNVGHCDWEIIELPVSEGDEMKDMPVYEGPRRINLNAFSEENQDGGSEHDGMHLDAELNKVNEHGDSSGTEGYSIAANEENCKHIAFELTQVSKDEFGSTVAFQNKMSLPQTVRSSCNPVQCDHVVENQSGNTGTFSVYSFEYDAAPSPDSGPSTTVILPAALKIKRKNSTEDCDATSSTSSSVTSRFSDCSTLTVGSDSSFVSGPTCKTKGSSARLPREKSTVDLGMKSRCSFSNPTHHPSPECKDSSISLRASQTLPFEVGSVSLKVAALLSKCDISSQSTECIHIQGCCSSPKSEDCLRSQEQAASSIKSSVSRAKLVNEDADDDALEEANCSTDVKRSQTSSYNDSSLRSSCDLNDKVSHQTGDSSRAETVSSPTLQSTGQIEKKCKSLFSRPSHPKPPNSDTCALLRSRISLDGRSSGNLRGSCMPCKAESSKYGIVPWIPNSRTALQAGHGAPPVVRNTHSSRNSTQRQMDYLVIDRTVSMHNVGSHLEGFLRIKNHSSKHIGFRVSSRIQGKYQIIPPMGRLENNETAIITIASANPATFCKYESDQFKVETAVIPPGLASPSEQRLFWQEVSPTEIQETLVGRLRVLNPNYFMADGLPSGGHRCDGCSGGDAIPSQTALEEIPAQRCMKPSSASICICTLIIGFAAAVIHHYSALLEKL